MGEAISETHNRRGVSVLVPQNSSQYQRVLNGIRKELNKNGISDPVNVITLSNLQRSGSRVLDNKKLVVIVGSRSFDQYLKSDVNSPYITSLITQNAFNYISVNNKNKDGFVGGVSIDQPTRRFLSLAKLVVPDLKNAALVFGPEVTKSKEIVLKGLKNYKFISNLIEILLNDNPINKLRKAYESNEVLILFPDRKKFNNSISRWILTLSYQYKIPVISYSKKYAKAGALVSLFSTSEQIGRQTAEMMISFLRNQSNKTNKLLEPKYFDIYINRSVESALNLTLPSKFELLKNIPN